MPKILACSPNVKLRCANPASLAMRSISACCRFRISLVSNPDGANPNRAGRLKTDSPPITLAAFNTGCVTSRDNVDSGGAIIGATVARGKMLLPASVCNSLVAF